MLNTAIETLSSSDSARIDAEILLMHVIDKDRSYIYAHSEDFLEPSQINTFDNLIQQRSKGVPIAYLTGTKEFWSRKFHVTKDTLIPRPETELLIETVLKLANKNDELNILDLGTGTGAIAITLAKELPLASLTATDISFHTLNVAKRNAEYHQINNIDLHVSDWFSHIKDKTFNFIISNPPYISESDPHLQQGDVQFEPISALTSGKNGLDDLTTIITQAQNYLESDGYLLVEHGFQQGKDVTILMEQENYQSIHALYDLAGHHRATMAMKK